MTTESAPAENTPVAPGANISSLADRLLEDDGAAIPAAFRAAEAAMRRMEAKYVSGEWSEAEYADGLTKIVVRGDGFEWTIGARSGEWYRRSPGGSWQICQPPRS